MSITITYADEIQATTYVDTCGSAQVWDRHDTYLPRGEYTPDTLVRPTDGPTDILLPHRLRDAKGRVWYTA